MRNFVTHGGVVCDVCGSRGVKEDPRKGEWFCPCCGVVVFCEGRCLKP